MAKIQRLAEKVRCTKDGATWGEYVTAGEVYSVTRRADGKGDAHFQRENGSGTFMGQWQFARAVKAGWLVIEAQ